MWLFKRKLTKHGSTWSGSEFYEDMKHLIQPLPSKASRRIAYSRTGRSRASGRNVRRCLLNFRLRHSWRVNSVSIYPFCGMVIQVRWCEYGSTVCRWHICALSFCLSLVLTVSSSKLRGCRIIWHGPPDMTVERFDFKRLKLVKNKMERFIFCLTYINLISELTNENTYFHFWNMKIESTSGTRKYRNPLAIYNFLSANFA